MSHIWDWDLRNDVNLLIALAQQSPQVTNAVIAGKLAESLKNQITGVSTPTTPEKAKEVAEQNSAGQRDTKDNPDIIFELASILPFEFGKLHFDDIQRFADKLTELEPSANSTRSTLSNLIAQAKEYMVYPNSSIDTTTMATVFIDNVAKARYATLLANDLYSILVNAKNLYESFVRKYKNKMDSKNFRSVNAQIMVGGVIESNMSDILKLQEDIKRHGK